MTEEELEEKIEYLEKEIEKAGGEIAEKDEKIEELTTEKQDLIGALAEIQRITTKYY